MKFKFDVAAAIPAAWDKLWANNLEQRKKDEADAKRFGKPVYQWQRTYYLTASDVENQVREFAAAIRDGLPWDKAPLAFGRPSHWPPVRIVLPGRKDLKGLVRDWLLRNPKITQHNFGKGHVSGAHFRPVGEVMPETEIKTIEARAERRKGLAKPRPVHFYDKGLLCQKERMKGRFSFYRRRSMVRSTSDRSKVTCKQCLNLLKGMKMAAKVVDRQGSISHMPDDNTH